MGPFTDALSCSFDLDPMTEVDDEYWENEDPELAFKQPAGKPSKVAFANCLIGLKKILGYASRTIVRSAAVFGYVSQPKVLTFVASIRSTSPSKPLATSARSGNSAPWRNWTPL